jgi:uncharacterized protein
MVPGPATDADVAGWTRGLGLPGLVDLHLHFLPERVMAKVWDYFENAGENYGTAWPVHYKLPESERLSALEDLGVVAFAPLVYPHKPGMAAWLNEWASEFAARVPASVPTATMYPEPGVTDYVRSALESGARAMKVHVQVGAFDPRDELLEQAWGLLAEAGIPVIIHCGHGPIPGAHTGLDVFAEVLGAHPRLTAVLAHAGMPEFDAALDLLERFPHVHLDTTMVGTPFSQQMAPLPADWSVRLVDHADRVALGTDFPNIPYDYATQLQAIAGWAVADERLGDGFLRAVLHDTPARLLGLA